MKFYYNGKLVRTSKNHHYTHAYIKHNDNGTFTCLGCSSSYKGIEKMMLSNPNYQNYRLYTSVQDGTYKPKDRYAYDIEKMKKQAVKYYGGVDEAVEYYKNIISRFEIVEIEEA